MDLQFLFQAVGADINAKGAKGKTALDHARERGLKRIEAVLVGHGTG